MKGDKPGGALAVFMGGKGAMPKGDGESDMKSAKMTAAEDALAAFKSGDATALSDALTRHYDACALGEDEEEYEDGEDMMGA